MQFSGKLAQIGTRRRLDLAEHVLGAVLARDAAEDDAVEQGVPAEAVVPVHATGHFACRSLP